MVFEMKLYCLQFRLFRSGTTTAPEGALHHRAQRLPPALRRPPRRPYLNQSSSILRYVFTHPGCLCKKKNSTFLSTYNLNIRQESLAWPLCDPRLDLRRYRRDRTNRRSQSDPQRSDQRQRGPHQRGRRPLSRRPPSRRPPSPRWPRRYLRQPLRRPLRRPRPPRSRRRLTTAAPSTRRSSMGSTSSAGPCRRAPLRPRRCPCGRRPRSPPGPPPEPRPRSRTAPSRPRFLLEQAEPRLFPRAPIQTLRLAPPASHWTKTEYTKLVVCRLR